MGGAHGAEHDARERAAQEQRTHARDGDGDGDGASVSSARRQAIVATEVGMLYPLHVAAPDVEFIPANAEASCRYMKMITLPKLRDALRDGVHEVKVPAEIADRARIPIERMVAIS